MSSEFWMAVGSIVLSLIVAIGGLMKGRSERIKMGGETYVSYQEALGKAQDNYEKLTKRLDELEDKHRKVLIHNGALIEQLIEHRIVPITMEQALSRNTRR